MPKILVLYNAPLLPVGHADAAAEHDVVQVAQAVTASLRQAGLDAEALGLGDSPAPLLRELADRRPAAIFNLYEGTGACGQTEAYVAGLLEWSGVPFTGCPMPAMVLARDKALTKRLLRGAGLPTADFWLVDPATEAPPTPASWPVIVKPCTEDASVGIDQGSVVETPVALAARLKWLAARYRPPFLVETYLAGGEFNVGVIDDPLPTALPVAEIVFDAAAMRPDSSPAAGGGPEVPLAAAPPEERGRDGAEGKGRRWFPIVTYRSKWEPGSDEDLAALPRCPARIDPGLARRLQELAVSAYRLLGCRDYGRVDFRLNAAGEPFILEVNPNPDFSSTAGLARALVASGRTWAGFAEMLVRRRLG